MSSDLTASAVSAQRWTLAVVVTTVAMFVAYLLRWVLLPFVIAGGLAVVLGPAVDWLISRLRSPRWVAATLVFLGILAALSAIGLGIEAYVMPQALSLLDHLQPTLERFLTIVLRGRTIDISGKTYGSKGIAELAMSNAQSALNPRAVLGHAAGALGAVMGFIMTLVLLLFFLLDGEHLARGALKLFPPMLRPRVANIAQRSRPVIFHYVAGVIVIVAYAAGLTFIAAKFFLHVDHPLLLAIAVGLLEMAPMVGPVLSVGMIALLAIGQLTFLGVVSVAIFATALRLSIDQLVGPIVLGRSMNLPPPVVIFAFLAGGTIWGVPGVVSAIPLAAIARIILQEAYGETGDAPAKVTWRKAEARRMNGQ